MGRRKTINNSICSDSTDRDHYWQNQLSEFCRIFGLMFKIRYSRGDIGLGCTRKQEVLLVYGRAAVQIRTKKWSSGYDTFSVSVDEGDDMERVSYKIMTKLSGNTIIWRWTDKQEDSVFGFTRIHKERWINLPVFGSVEELKLKAIAQGIEL